jgi:GH25 family lysozyme M1 (1,4-beta-N-acetylmuramidase)
MPASRSCRRALTAISALATVSVLTLAPLGAAPPAAAAPADLARFPKGVDVSSHQHPDGRPIDWKAVRASGITFAFIKADEGPRPSGEERAGRGAGRYTNPWFRRDGDGARAAGVLVGAYHYARPRKPVAATAEADARAFVTLTGPARRGAIPPVLDLEETGGLGARDITAWATRWMTTVEALTGRTPVLYTGLWFWNSYLDGTGELARHPLWIARYAESPGLLPGGWRAWSFWQFTARGRVPGIAVDVDINLSCGRPTDLANECRGTRYDDWAASRR